MAKRRVQRVQRPIGIVTMRSRSIFAALIALFLASQASAETGTPSPAPSLQSGTVIEAAERLKPGEFLWAPEIAPQGPIILMVSLKTQRAVIYRNGVPIGISTVSTGRPGYETPTGVFVILQKHVEHYSNIYDNAPMPYMQRLTWGGVALHAGKLPGYPASHGCIRLPHEFARLLYRVTQRGMTVVISDSAVLPRVAPAEALLLGGTSPRSLAGDSIEWNPQKAPVGPLSIIVSAADRRVVVLRAGHVIGSSPIEIDGTIDRTSAYLLDGVVDGERKWVRVALPGQNVETSQTLRGRIRVPDSFRNRLDPIIRIGTTVIVTGDALRAGSPGTPLTVIESDRPD